METRSNHLLVGSIVLGLLAALVAFAMWIAGLSGSNAKEYDIFFRQSVDGLAKGGSVSFSGVHRGRSPPLSSGRMTRSSCVSAWR